MATAPGLIENTFFESTASKRKHPNKLTFGKK
jgi:hypothetical protein